MATALVSQPPETVMPAGNDLIYEFSGDNDPNIKIAYRAQFKHVLGSYQEIVTGQVSSEIGNVKINFSEDVQAVLATQYNDDADEVTPDTSIDDNAAGLLLVEYGEAVYDPNTNQTTINYGNSLVINVFNGAFQYSKDFDDEPLTIANIVPLTLRPTQNYICADQSDWIHVIKKGEGNVNVEVKGFDKDGVEVADVDASEAPQPGIPVVVPCGTQNGLLKGHANFDQIVKYTVRLYKDALATVTYNFQICDCPFEYELHFLEPTGSWASIAFKQSTLNPANDVERINVDKYRPVGGTINTEPQSIVTAKSNITLTTVVPWDREAQYFFLGLMSSQDVRIRLKNLKSQYVVRRFIMEGGSINAYDSRDVVEVEIVGTIGENVINLRV